MGKTGKFASIAVLSVLLSGCSFNLDSIKSFFKKTAKETADLIYVRDAKKESLRDETKNLYAVEFELESQKPYQASDTSVLDIAATPKSEYLNSFKAAMVTYEQKNGHSNITQKGYYSKADQYVKYEKNGEALEITKTEDSYTAKRDGVEIDMDNPDVKSECENGYSIWENQMNYCFSFELNSFINLKARLIGSTADNSSDIDFLTKVTFKDYKDAGNYVAMYNGEAHKNDGSNDVTIDYVEIRYVDYRLQQSLVHSVTVNYDSLIESHKLAYTKFLYNVSLEDCF